MGVRHERVVLTLEDKFSSGMARAATAAGALDKQLDSISKRAVVTSRAQAQVAQSVDRTDVSVRRATASIDRYSGRLGLLADLVATLGPALSPIGASSVGLIGGLANQLSVAVLAGGSAILAFQGVGEAMKAVNTAAVEPTTENLEKASAAMRALDPATRDAVAALQSMKPILAEMKSAGAQAIMPGVASALEDLAERGPEVTGIVFRLNSVLGDLMADGASALASEGWDEFFDFLAVDSAQTLESMGRSVGSLAKGFSELWMAFDPLSDGFNDWLEDASAGFADWADGLSESERFQDFVDYIFKSGPQVTSSLTAMAVAFLAVMEAASPLGGPVLAALEAVSEAISTIARSDLGTPIMTGVAALALFNRTAAVTAGLAARGGLMGMLTGSAVAGAGRGVKGAAGSIRADLAAMSSGLVAWGHDADKAGAAADRMKGRMASAGKAGAGIAGIGIAASGAAEGMELANTATLGLMGTMLGPWGAGIGAGVGLLMDFASANDEAANATDNLLAAIERQGGTATLAEVDALAAQRDEAAKRVEKLRKREKGSKVSSLVDGLFGDSALDGEMKKLKEAEEGLSDLESEARRLAALDLEAQKWEEFAASVDVSREAADATSASFLTLGESLNDPEVSLGGWLAELEANNNALRDFRVNAEEAARKGLDEGLIAKLREAGPEGARRMKQLADSSKTEIGRFNKEMRRAERQSDATAASVAGIPSKVTTEIAQKGMPKSIADIVRLKEKYDLTPEEVNTLATLSGVGDVEAMLDNLARTRTANINVVTTQLTAEHRQAYQGKTVNANGSVADYYANGGLRENHVAQIAPANTIRVWAEPETGGEAYIPLAASKRNRSLDIWAETGRRLGVQGFAAGGIAGEGVYRSPLAFNGDQMRVGGVWRDFERGLKILTRTLDKSEKSLDKMRDRLEEVRDKMATAGSNSVDQFAADLWAGPSSPWSAGGSGPLSALSTSSADLRARRDLQLQLKKRGLKGDAYSAAMTGSNEDLRGLLSRDEVGKFQSAFDGNAKLQTVVASEAGKYAYGKQEAARIADVRGIKSEVQGLRKDMKEAERRQAKREKDNADRTGKAVGKTVSKTAGRGAAKSKK